MKLTDHSIHMRNSIIMTQVLNGTRKESKPDPYKAKLESMLQKFKSHPLFQEILAARKLELRSLF